MFSFNYVNSINDVVSTLALGVIINGSILRNVNDVVSTLALGVIKAAEGKG